MPLNQGDLQDVQRRVYGMFMDSVATVRAIRDNADWIFGDTAPELRAAIDEYMRDFIDNPQGAKQEHPETVVFRTGIPEFQRAGLYGAQLAAKERQVLQANVTVRQSLLSRARNVFRAPFKKWVDRVNNFLRSLSGATGLGEALQEIKDLLAGELPDDKK